MQKNDVNSLKKKVNFSFLKHKNKQLVCVNECYSHINI